MTDKEFYEASQNEMIKQFREQLSKYVHYQLVLCVAAIGFSVTLSLNLKLTATQIPLGLAVLLWSISIFYGFATLESDIDMIKTNHNYFNLELNKISSKELTQAERINLSNIFKEEMRRLSNRIPKLRRRQELLFYFGMISFLVWCVFKMSLN